MNPVLRPLEKKDNNEIADLIRSVFREFKIDRPGTVYTDPTTDDLFSLFQASGSIYWIAEDNGIIIGGCGIFPTPGLPAGYAELVKLYLASTHRGKGIGNMLMHKSIRSAREMGFTHVYLESLPELSRAVGMYLRSGFVHISHPLGNSGHFGCTIWMVKDLTKE